jgi:hypothetical protein
MRTRFQLVLVAALALARAAHAEAKGAVYVAPFDCSAVELDKGSQVVLDETLLSISAELLEPAGFDLVSGVVDVRDRLDKSGTSKVDCDFVCRLKQAREAKAAFFVSGRLGKSDGTLIAFIRLYRTSDGRQSQSVDMDGATVKDLRAAFRKWLPTLYVELLQVPAKPAVATPAVAAAPPPPAQASVVLPIPPSAVVDATAAPDQPMPLPPPDDPPTTEGSAPDSAHEARVRDAGGIRLMKCDEQLVDTYAARQRLASQAQQLGNKAPSESLQSAVAADQTAADRLATCARIYGALYRYSAVVLAEGASAAPLATPATMEPKSCAELGRRIAENRSYMLNDKPETEADASRVADEQARIATIVEGLEGLRRFCR